MYSVIKVRIIHFLVFKTARLSSARVFVKEVVYAKIDSTETIH